MPNFRFAHQGHATAAFQLGSMLAWLPGLLLLPLLLTAADLPSPSGKLLEEAWYLVQLDQEAVGSWRMTVRETTGTDPSKSAFLVSQELELVLQRYGSTIRLKQEVSNLEDNEGRVEALTLKQGQNGKVLVQIEGKRDAEDPDRMLFRDGAGKELSPQTWSGSVLGLRAREQLPEKRNLQAGESARILGHEPLINQVVGLTVTMLPPEKLAVGGESVELVRVDWKPKLLREAAVELGSTSWWLDAERKVVRRKMQLDGLGAVVLTKSTPEAVRLALRETKGKDLGEASLIPLDRPVPNIKQARRVIYRLRPKGEGNLFDIAGPNPIAEDLRQQARLMPDGSIEIAVFAGKKPDRVVGAADAPREFYGTSKFIDTDHPKVRQVAAMAGGLDGDCWTAATRLERFVQRNLKPDSAAPLASVSEFLGSWRGDCRHAALTLAALCRASNMPARTAFGLLYVQKSGSGGTKPYLGFHAWTEVWIDGQWVGLDGTQGMGKISAGHLKICDHSWDKVDNLAPLAPVQKLVGKLTGEVVRVDVGD